MTRAIDLKEHFEKKRAEAFAVQTEPEWPEGTPNFVRRLFSLIHNPHTPTPVKADLGLMITDWVQKTKMVNALHNNDGVVKGTENESGNG